MVFTFTQFMEGREMMDAVEVIRKDMEVNAPLAEGSVVRFTSTSRSAGRDYTYVAVFTAGMWWLSGFGNFFGERKFSHSDFMKIIGSHPSVSSVEVATAWTAVR